MVTNEDARRVSGGHLLAFDYGLLVSCYDDSQIWVMSYSSLKGTKMALCTRADRKIGVSCVWKGMNGASAMIFSSAWCQRAAAALTVVEDSASVTRLSTAGSSYPPQSVPGQVTG